MSLYDDVQSELRKAGLVDWRFHTAMVLIGAIVGLLIHDPVSAFLAWLTAPARGAFLGGFGMVSFYVLREGEQSSRTSRVTWDTARDFLAPTGLLVFIVLIVQLVTGGFF